MKKLSQEQIDDIKGRFLRGQPLVDAAFELGLSLSTVSKYYEAARRDRPEARPESKAHRFSNRREVRESLGKWGLCRSCAAKERDTRLKGWGNLAEKSSIKRSTTTTATTQRSEEE